VAEIHSLALPPGYRLGEYEIIRVLGAGGFGITYLAFDHQLDGPVALKEYFPADVATRVGDSTVTATSRAGEETFAWGLDRFAKEARAIHRLRHQNVVQVYRYLEANGTAYIVMEYVEGESLKAILERRGSLPAEEWRPWMDSLLEGLAHVHCRGLLHRDIKPANIVVRAEDRQPVLIDFGSARLQHRDRTHTQVLTAGYAPIEQYTSGTRQGPASDIYSLAAVSHRVLAGEPVAGSPDRTLADEYRPLAERIAGADFEWLAAIDHGLALRPQDRPQTVADWRAELTEAQDPAAGPAVVDARPVTPDPSAGAVLGTAAPGLTADQVANRDASHGPLDSKPERSPTASEQTSRLTRWSGNQTVALAVGVLVAIAAAAIGIVLSMRETAGELRSALQRAREAGSEAEIGEIERELATR